MHETTAPPETYIKIEMSEERLRQIFDQLADPASKYYQQRIFFITSHARELLNHRPDLSAEDILQTILQAVWKTLHKKIHKGTLTVEDRSTQVQAVDQPIKPADEEFLEKYLAKAISQSTDSLDMIERMKRAKNRAPNVNWPSFNELELGIYKAGTNYGRGSMGEPHEDGDDRSAIEIVGASPKDRRAIMRRWSSEANKVIFDLTQEEMKRLSSALLISDDVNQITHLEKYLLVLARDIEKLSGKKLDKNVIAFLHQINGVPIEETLGFFDLENNEIGKNYLYIMRHRGKKFVRRYW